MSIVWSYIHTSSFGQSLDKELAEVFLSISGTIIFDDRGNELVKPTLVNDNMLDMMINGGKIEQVYQCGDDKCLIVRTNALEIAKDSAFIHKVMTYLISIQQKIKDDTIPLTSAEKSFLNMVSLPVLKFMQTGEETGVSLNIGKYAEIIATDIVIGYINGILNYIKAKVPMKYSIEINSTLVDSYQSVEKYINTKQQLLYTRLASEEQIIDGIRQMQKQLASNTTASLKENIAF